MHFIQLVNFSFLVLSQLCVLLHEIQLLCCMNSLRICNVTAMVWFLQIRSLKEDPGQIEMLTIFSFSSWKKRTQYHLQLLFSLIFVVLESGCLWRNFTRRSVFIILFYVAATSCFVFFYHFILLGWSHQFGKGNHFLFQHSNSSLQALTIGAETEFHLCNSNSALLSSPFCGPYFQLLPPFLLTPVILPLANCTELSLTVPLQCWVCSKPIASRTQCHPASLYVCSLCRPSSA